MGVEMLAALSALIVAATAIVRLQKQSKEFQVALATIHHERISELAALQSRLKGSQAQDTAPPAPGSGAVDGVGEARQLRSLASTVQVLELRAREHDALLCSLVSEDEARHLWNISRQESIRYDFHPGVQEELRSLVRRGLVEKRIEFKIHELEQSFVLGAHFKLTEIGEMLLSLRKHLEAADLRVMASLPPRPINA